MDVNALITALGSADVAERRAAAESLSREGIAAAVIPLVQACHDPDEQVREFANAALEELGPPPLAVAPQLVAPLRQPGLAGYWAATLLGRLEAAAAPWASDLAAAVERNADTSVRQRAAWALGKIGPEAAAAVPALAAASQNTDARLARLAASALQKINPAR